MKAANLERSYVYLPAHQWDAVDALRANTVLSISQYIDHLITAAKVAKENNDRKLKTR